MKDLKKLQEITKLQILIFLKKFQVMPSGTAFDQNTMKPLDMIVPYKTRCGSLDPLEMSEETKCNCWQTSGEGSCKYFWYFEL